MLISTGTSLRVLCIQWHRSLVVLTNGGRAFYGRYKLRSWIHRLFSDAEYTKLPGTNWPGCTHIVLQCHVRHCVTVYWHNVMMHHVIIIMETGAERGKVSTKHLTPFIKHYSNAERGGSMHGDKTA